jgi:hypothetical protein
MIRDIIDACSITILMGLVLAIVMLWGLMLGEYMGRDIPQAKYEVVNGRY